MMDVATNVAILRGIDDLIKLPFSLESCVGARLYRAAVVTSR
jgi:hypothetical protein